MNLFTIFIMSGGGSPWVDVQKPKGDKMKVSQKFLDAWKVGKITKVYDGKDNACRCGCEGKYYYESDNAFPYILSAAIGMIQKGKIMEGPGFVNISYGRNRAYTIYYE